MTSDDRISRDLIIDVLSVLERHGYRGCGNEQSGKAILVIGHLARVYEGTRDAPYYNQAPPSPHPEPGRPAPEVGQDAVILTGADVGTVVAALDVAADYKRDRAETCADCADRSCPTCQSRLKAAQAYDQLAAQMLRTGQAAHASQPEPGRSGQADPAVDKEAGQ